MLQTGLVVLVYVVYHLLHFTVRVTDAEAAKLAFSGDVYGMVVLGFKPPLVVLVYVVANAMLAWHLSHGIASFFQTLGLSHPKYNHLRRPFAVGFALVVFIGFLTPPTLVLAGVIS